MSSAMDAITKNFHSGLGSASTLSVVMVEDGASMIITDGASMPHSQWILCTGYTSSMCPSRGGNKTMRERPGRLAQYKKARKLPYPDDLNKLFQNFL